MKPIKTNSVGNKIKAEIVDDKEIFGNTETCIKIENDPLYIEPYVKLELSSVKADQDSSNQDLTEEEYDDIFSKSTKFSRVAETSREKRTYSILTEKNKPTSVIGAKCPICPKWVRYKRNLVNHIKLHVDPKPAQSPDVSHSFPHKVHIKEYTEDFVRSFGCTHCAYKSIYETNVRRHMLTHTGEKPFPCPFCPYKASQKVHLQGHILKHST